MEHVDVLIVGAGISGIGAACYLERERPGTSYAILEARAATGGTWDLFRYPGIRSDSDLHSFGYAFKPWVDDKAIAGADSILAYVRETAAEHGVDRHIRLQHRVRGAAWSSAEARWTVDIERGDAGERVSLSCRWLFCASGYYRYDEGFRPRFPGEERFAGTILHPQHWPEGLDHTGKRVVVIGSGATAVTVVPAMAEKAAHVTMLQRTPSYVLPVPSEDKLANQLRELLPEKWAYELTRRKNIARQQLIWQFCQKFPGLARAAIRAINVAELPPGYPVDKHFNPTYAPWDQRLCMVADGDLFKAIREGKASVVTDTITTFTERGIRVSSGEEIEADLVVAATGLNLLPFGGIELRVDGAPVRLAEKVAFKGMMLNGVPNFAFAIGYTNSSWTLKVGLLCRHFCQLLGYMDEHGYASVAPELADPTMKTRPLLAFGAGYVQRSLADLPRQGADAPWLTSMSYQADLTLLGQGAVADEHLRFAPPPASAGVGAATAGEQVFDGRICYRTYGKPSGEPLVLIAGLGLHLTSWPPAMIDAFVARGFHVITFDNRDVGRSARGTGRAPGVRQLLTRTPEPGYDLGDLARDTIDLMDHLGLPSAHLVGMSMGGMIGQTIAARHPERVRTLTSIFSTTGARTVGQPALSTMLRLGKPASKTRAAAVEGYLAMLRHIGGGPLGLDEAAVRREAGIAWDRGGGRSGSLGFARQINAILRSGDRTAELRTIVAPTLVIHGDRDLLVHPSGGAATAKAIRGAKLVTLPGMRHYFAAKIIPRLVELTVAHIDAHAPAAASATPRTAAAR
jgi:cation diffusion facilitator CzcD-associated flavoprotein CzcO/pimeloyl-ACP methyl ester carboxylesterase